MYTSKQLGTATGRLIGWLIVFYNVHQIGGWNWTALVFGAVLATPVWWWNKT